MKHKLLMILSLLMFLGLGGIAVAGSDPGILDTLRLDDVTANAGEKAVMNVYFYNDEELASITAPLKWSSSDVTLDSISWVGSRVLYLGTRIGNIDNANQTANVTAIVMFESFIPAGQGLAFKLYFDIPSGTPDQVVTLDTTEIGLSYFFFGLPSSDDFVPQLKTGTLTIGGGSAEGDQPVMPTVNSLNQNYPNPFNPTTKIAFSLQRKSNVKLTVFNVLGQEVATLANGEFEAGTYIKEWNGKDINGRTVSSGVYFYKLVTDGFSEARRMVFMK